MKKSGHFVDCIVSLHDDPGVRARSYAMVYPPFEMRIQNPKQKRERKKKKKKKGKVKK